MTRDLLLAFSRHWLLADLQLERKQLPVFLRQGFRPALAITNDVNGFAGGQHFAALVTQNFVRKTDAAAPRFAHPRPDSKQIVVARRAKIAAARFRYHDVAVVLALHLLVGYSSLAHVFHAADCEKCEVVRSEEHTSELQSRRDLVCRLLLEK